MINRIARAYRAGGVTEIGRRAYKHYIKDYFQPPFEKVPLLLDYYINKERKQMNDVIQEFEQSGLGKRLVKNDLTPHKTSDSLFILAGGNTINQISDEQWEVIDKHDTVGLNRWPVHEFVPTYHVFEIPNNEHMRELFLQLLEYRKSAYKDTPVIIKDISRTPEIYRSSDIKSRISGNLFLSRDSAFLKIRAGKEPQRQLLEWLHSHGYFTPGGSFNLLFRVRASISYLLNFAVLMDYDRIVLCGVDMVDSEYFFMTDKYHNKDIPIPEPKITETDRVHPTNDGNGRITLEELIYLINDTILITEDINLYVENEKSALYPRVPVYAYPSLD